MPRIIVEEDVEALAIGGTILGGGGGGWHEIGRNDGLLSLQIGKVELWRPDEAEPFKGLDLHDSCSSSIVYEMYPRVT